MKRFFLDTNVILDFMLEREPHAFYAQALFAAAEAGDVQLFAASLSFSNIFYIARKELGRDATLTKIEDLMNRLSILAVDDAVLRRAVSSAFKDFEDALQYFCTTQSSNVQAIVTRNEKDFALSSVPVISPQDAAASLL